MYVSCKGGGQRGKHEKACLYFGDGTIILIRLLFREVCHVPKILVMGQSKWLLLNVLLLLNSPDRKKSVEWTPGARS
jgi:hypothetical protein